MLRPVAATVVVVVAVPSPATRAQREAGVRQVAWMGQGVVGPLSRRVPSGLPAGLGFAPPPPVRGVVDVTRWARHWRHARAELWLRRLTAPPHHRHHQYHRLHSHPHVHSLNDVLRMAEEGRASVCEAPLQHSRVALALALALARKGGGGWVQQRQWQAAQSRDEGWRWGLEIGVAWRPCVPGNLVRLAPALCAVPKRLPRLTSWNPALPNAPACGRRRHEHLATPRTHRHRHRHRQGQGGWQRRWWWRQHHRRTTNHPWHAAWPQPR